jgi:hypothetical protein
MACGDRGATRWKKALKVGATSFLASPAFSPPANARCPVKGPDEEARARAADRSSLESYQVQTA